MGGILRWLAVVGLALVGFGVLLLVAISELSAPVRVRDLALAAASGLAYLAAALQLARSKRWLGVGLGWAMLLATFVLILPDLQRVRISANESATIGDLRALVAAPGTASAGLAQPIRSGYRRTLHLPAAKTATQSRFAITASPVEPGREGTGVRGFCADTTGVMCFSADGTAPPLRPDGTCDTTSNQCNVMK